MKNSIVYDAELLKSAMLFDRQALAKVYDLYSPELYRYAMRLLGDSSLAEECVAETFSRLLQAIRGRKGPKNYLKAYLYRIAHNWITDLYQRQPPSPIVLDDQHPEETEGVEERASQQLRQKCIRNALNRLTPDQQQVIALKFIEGWENEEIAYALNKPVGAIKSLQHRALASLKRFVQDEELI